MNKIRFTVPIFSIDMLRHRKNVALNGLFKKKINK